jgi:hypothetical protein
VHLLWPGGRALGGVGTGVLVGVEVQLDLVSDFEDTSGPQIHLACDNQATSHPGEMSY